MCPGFFFFVPLPLRGEEAENPSDRFSIGTAESRCSLTSLCHCFCLSWEVVGMSSRMGSQYGLLLNSSAFQGTVFWHFAKEFPKEA